MDPFDTGRDGEEELFGIVRTKDGGAENYHGAEDGSWSLNDLGPGMELDKRKQAPSAMTAHKMLDRQRYIKPLINH
jgi:hypothetical protein